MIKDRKEIEAEQAKLPVGVKLSLDKIT